PVRESGDVAHAAHGFGDGAEARPVAVRPVLPVARQPHEDEAGVVRREAVVAKAPLLQRARAKVLDHDVGPGGEPAHQVLALGLAQVDADGALVAGLHDPPQRGAGRIVGPQLAPLAQRVAALAPRPRRRLDLDHVGTQVGKQHPAVRAHQHVPDLDDALAAQRQSHDSILAIVAMTSASGISLVNTPRTPRSRSLSWSGAGIVPPTNTGMSSACSERNCSSVSSTSSLWLPERIDSPTASTSSSTATRAM